MRHGTNVVGITASTMKTINKMAARSKGRVVGRSNFARLAIDNFNPGHLLFLDPLASWTKGLWGKTVDHETLHLAWKNASCTAGAAADPMANAQGAAGSYLAILLHLGWTAPSFEQIRTTDVDQNGNVITLHLLKTCPRVIMQWAKRRLNEIDAAESQLGKKVGGPPDLEPLADVLRGKKLRDSTPMKSLRAMGEGG